jgi:hypothetical protein
MICDIAISGAGANPLNAADFGGAFPAWTGVTIAAGQLTATRTFAATDDADVEPDETGRVTISNAIGATIGTATADFTVANNDSAPTSYPAPYFDTFIGVTPAASFAGRPLESGGVVWEDMNTNGRVDNTRISIATSGILAGAAVTTTAVSEVHAGFQSGTVSATPRRWASFKLRDRMAVSSASGRPCLITSHQPYPAAASDGILIVSGTSPGDSPTTIGFRETQAGAVVGSTISVSNVSLRVGDVLTMKHEQGSGTNVATLLMNGRPQAQKTGLVIPVTGKTAFRGCGPVDGLDAIIVSNPDVDGGLIVEAPARVRAATTAAGSSAVVVLYGECAGAVPATLYYNAVDVATGAVISGHNDQPLTNLTSAGLTWRATTPAIPVPATGAYLVVRRKDIEGGGQAIGMTPTFRAGTVGAWTGQSLNALGLEMASGGSDPVAGDCFKAEGYSVSSVAMSRVMRQVSTGGGATAAAISAMQSAGLTGPHAIAMAAIGNTVVKARNPGGTPGLWEGVVDTIRHVGGRLSYVADSSGEYEIANSATGGFYPSGGVEATADYKAQLIAMMDAIDALSGSAVPCSLSYLGAVWNVTDEQAQAIRRKQWELAQAYPTRFFIGNNPLDLQHNSADQYHLTGAGNIEKFRRHGWGIAKMLGLAANDRTGPKMVSAARSGTDVTVTFDLNGASALEITGTAYASDFRCGLDFASDAAFTSPIFPTSATVSGSTVVFGFASAPGPTYVRAAWGREPYGRGAGGYSGVTAIRDNLAANAAAIRGVFTGEATNPPVQPYFHSSGNDYVVAS